MQYDYDMHKKQLFIYDLRGDSLQRRTGMDGYERLIWVTEGEEPVLMGSAEDGQGISNITCLDCDDGVKWTFRPETTEKYNLECLDVTAEGIISVFRQDINSGKGTVYRIDAKDGSIVCSRELEIIDVRYVPSADIFAAELPEREGILLLDGALNEISRLPLENLKRFMPGSMTVYETELWEHYCLDGRFKGLDLKTGKRFDIRPELPAGTLNILPGGLFAAASENNDSLMIFDREGRLLSRHKLESLSIDRLADGSPCAIEIVWNRGGKYEPGTYVEDIRVWAIREVE